ncbi:MAG: DNA replication/repair protein RecF [Rhodobacteraceae bacterium]|nr:DNA replication/repair protein RecF [Paracoccaceae bacterium]
MSVSALTELTLSHFRSHRDTRIILDGRPVAIFGLNGAGKTNILEAISLLSPGRGMRGSKVGDMVRYPEGIGWKISTVLKTSNLTHKVEIRTGPNLNRLTSIDGKVTSQLALGELVKIIWLTPNMDRLWVDGPEVRRRFVDRITHSFIPRHAQEILSYEKAMRERNRLLKEASRNLDWYRAIESQMAVAGTKIIENRNTALEKLSISMKISQTSFPVADLSLINEEKDLNFFSADQFREVLEIKRSKDLYLGRTSVGPHKTDLKVQYKEKGIDAKYCSTGEQKALLISLILANARGLLREEGAPPIMLLDEVSAHLDYKRRQDLYEEISSLGAQAWMTGTDVDLFKEILNISQQFKVVDKNGKSSVLIQ